MFNPFTILCDDPEITEMYAAACALRNIHIDASRADDMDTAMLANLLIRPTDGELGDGLTAKDYEEMYG